MTRDPSKEIVIAQEGTLRPLGVQPCIALYPQDFLILEEGAGNSRAGSVRDVSIGVASSGLMGAISLYVSVDFLEKNAAGIITGLRWGPALAMFLLSVGTLVSLILVIAFWKKAVGDTGRTSYVNLVNRIRSELQLPKSGS